MWTRSSRRVPKNLDAHLTKGDIFLAKREGTNAVAEFRTVVTERPQFVQGYVKMAEGHTLAKEYDLAIDTLQNGLKQEPKSRELMVAMARICVIRKDYEKAEEQLKKALVENPNDGNLMAELGDFYQMRKETGKAEAQYTEIKHKFPNVPVGYVKLAGSTRIRATSTGPCRSFREP